VQQTRPWPLAQYLGPWLPVAGRKTGQVTIAIPSDFSVMRDPAEVAAAARAVCAAATSPNRTEIFFDHSNLVTFDLPAEAVLDVIAREARNNLLRRGRPIRLGGAFPNEPVAQRFIRGIGISRHLDVPNTGLPAAEEEKLFTFQQHKRTPAPRDAPAHTDEKSRATAAFADFVDDCLGTVNRALTIQGRKRLCDYTGEIIDNIEQHADTNFWYIAGYLDTLNQPPTCEIAIFNFGRTFSQTFTELNEEDYPRLQVAPYIEKHRGNRWFGTGWNEEDLYTLAALQGGISSKANSDLDGRGQGTTDLIQFFQHVHRECGGQGSSPEMVLWSGNTHILFDGKYQLARDAQGRWTIAFNESNSLGERPDANYVKHLPDAHFPGTMIGIRFALTTSETTVATGRRKRRNYGN